MQQQQQQYNTYMYEPDCCGCFPLECGVRTLFFLVFIGIIGTIINVVVQAIDEQWYVFIQLLMLLPAIYTLFWVLQWMNMDTFRARYKISQGFQCMFITNIFVNLVILFVVIFALNEFWESDEADEQFNQYYANRTAGYLGVQGLYGNPAYPYAGNISGGYLPYGQAPLTGNPNAPYQPQYYNQYQQVGQYAGQYGVGPYANTSYPGGYNYYANQYNAQRTQDKEEVKTATIVAFAVGYGIVILITGFIGFYWWTVVRRWANMLMNHVQPYGQGGGSMRGDGMGGGMMGQQNKGYM